AGQQLPAQPVAQGQAAVYLVLVLRKQAELGRGSPYIRAGDSEVERGRSAFEKISKCISREIRLKDKAAEIIGCKLRSKAFQVEITHPPYVDSTLHRVLAKSPCQVIAELGRLGLRDARLISANGRKTGAGVEIKSRECMRERM